MEEEGINNCPWIKKTPKTLFTLFGFNSPRLASYFIFLEFGICFFGI